jgi:small-conductance mechanosensitive channel
MEVMRDYLRRLKRAFDERGIEIPFPQMRLHVPQSAQVPATAPADA